MCAIPAISLLLSVPAVAAVPSTGPSSPCGPVSKQTNSETPLSSWYVLACLLKVCQLLNSWVITWFGVLFFFVFQTMSSKEKAKFDEMAKADKVRYDREMKDYGPAKGGKKKKDPNAPKRPP